MTKHAEDLAKLGWQYFECPACGSEGARAFPKPEQEPVAWTLLLVGEHHGIIGKAGDAFASAPEHYRRVDVYTTPPQRKPLTELEAETLFDNCGGKWNGDHWVIKDADLHDFARAIEAKLNIKGE